MVAAMIKPTVGRNVWFRMRNFNTGDGQQPMHANIAYVHSDTRINIGYLTPMGTSGSQTSVLLWDGQGDPPMEDYCEWMPYQVGQAKRETNS